MKVKKKIIIGNWKMNPQTFTEAKKIFSGIKKTASVLKKVITVICPPYIFLEGLSEKLSKKSFKNIFIGAQDCFNESAGSYTGYVSSIMIKSVGAEYVILGHSERRARGETDEIINLKIKVALEAGLTVVLCVGEKERTTNGEYLGFIQNQLQNSLLKISKYQVSKVIIAYEPVWAVGRKDWKTIDPRDLQEMSLFIKKILTQIYNKEVVANIPILYGGSLLPENALSILRDGRIDGLLVGRASLSIEDFSAILKEAENV